MLKNYNYTWLTYDHFKKSEKDLIQENNKGMEIDVINNLIDSINKLDLHEDNKDYENENINEKKKIH